MDIISEQPADLMRPLLLTATPLSKGQVVRHCAQTLPLSLAHLLKLIVEIHPPVPLRSRSI